MRADSAPCTGSRVPTGIVSFVTRDSFLLAVEGFEGREDAVGAGVDADRRQVAPADDALGIDDEEGATGRAGLRRIDAIVPGNGALGLEVREKRELEPAVLLEREVAPDAVDRDPEQLGAELPEFRQDLVIERHLVAADGAPVRRIKREDDGAPEELAERDLLIGRAVQAELRSARAGGQDPLLRGLTRFRGRHGFPPLTLRFQRPGRWFSFPSLAVSSDEALECDGVLGFRNSWNLLPIPCVEEP